MITLLLGSVAAAQQSCLQPVSLMQIGAELGEVEKSVEVKDIPDVRARLDRITERLPCLDDVLPANAWAEYARYVSIAFFFRQDEDEMLRWHQSSVWADPGLEWGAAFPPTHPLRRIGSEAAVAGEVTLPDRGIAPPKGGGVFVSGHLVTTPTVPADVPVFVQVFDKDRVRVTAFFQNGTAFPETWLGPVGEVVAPEWWGQPAGPVTTRVARTRRERSGDGPPVAAIVTGGTLLAASGVSYFLAGRTADSMAGLGSSGDLTRARTQANLLVVVSGATLASGLGVLGGGVLLAGDGFTVRF